MSVLIKVVAFADGRDSAIDGQWLESYDPEGYGGRGAFGVTPDRAKALRFPDHAAAFEFWRQVPRSRLCRTDGEPNRPLTALTITILPDDEQAPELP